MNTPVSVEFEGPPDLQNLYPRASRALNISDMSHNRHISTSAGPEP